MFDFDTLYSKIRPLRMFCIVCFSAAGCHLNESFLKKTRSVKNVNLRIIFNKNFMHGQSMSARRNSKVSRRRYTYTQNDRTRWLAIGTLLVASAATLGYICGKYSEKQKLRKEKLSKLINFNNNNNNNIPIKQNKINAFT